MRLVSSTTMLLIMCTRKKKKTPSQNIDFILNLVLSNNSHQSSKQYMSVKEHIIIINFISDKKAFKW